MDFYESEWLRLNEKYQALATAGDRLAHELMHREHPTILDTWWKVRGHDNCSVCSPRAGDEVKHGN